MFDTESVRLVNDSLPWFFATAAAVFGTIVGSFLNVCIYRMPKGLSVVSPGSRCACGASIPAWRNIPILAWLIWGRKTPCCGRAYSPRYAIVEALVGALFAACWLVLPFPVSLAAMVFCAWLVLLAFIDLDTMYLPDSPNILLGFFGLACSAILPALHGHGHLAMLPGSILSVWSGLLGVALGTALVYWFRLLAGWLMRREAMGEGDVILVGSMGAFLGWKGAIFSFFGGALYGCVLVLPLMLLKKKPDASARARNASCASFEGDEADEMIASGADMGLPFGPWIALAGVTYLLVAKPWFDRYLNEFLAVFSEFR